MVERHLLLLLEVNMWTSKNRILGVRFLQQSRERLMIQHNKENNPNWKGGQEKRICPYCNDVFYEWKSQEKITCGKKECHSLRLSEVKKGKINLLESNGMWKGKNVGYDALHGWIRTHKTKPLMCEECKQAEPKDLANISGSYLRDINDFEWLCRKCHNGKRW